MLLDIIYETTICLIVQNNFTNSRTNRKQNKKLFTKYLSFTAIDKRRILGKFSPKQSFRPAMKFISKREATSDVEHATLYRRDKK